MRQFILPEDWDGGPTCRVEGSRAHYVSRVLRLGRGDSFPGRDAEGRLWRCSILESAPGYLLVGLAPRAEESSDGGCRLFLAMGLPKGAKMDLVVRQATEAGVWAVLPLLTARSLARLEEEEGAREASKSRLGRWERIVKEALQQSGSSLKTEIVPPLPLSELPAALASRGVSASDPKILLHEAPLAQSSMHEYLTTASEAVALCVGPEGGFAPEEVAFLVEGGFRPLRLAGAVLRAETAALYAIAAAKIVLSERPSWIPKLP